MNTKNSLTELELKVELLGDLNAEIKELTERAEALKSEIKDDLSAAGLKELNTVHYKLSYTESNRRTVDYAKLIEDIKAPEDYVEKFARYTAVFTLKIARV